MLVTQAKALSSLDHGHRDAGPEKCGGNPLRDAADQLRGAADMLEKFAHVYQRMADQEEN